MSGQSVDQEWALASLACAVAIGLVCAYRVWAAKRRPYPDQTRLLWALVGMYALATLPLIGWVL